MDRGETRLCCFPRHPRCESCRHGCAGWFGRRGISNLSSWRVLARKAILGCAMIQPIKGLGSEVSISKSVDLKSLWNCALSGTSLTNLFLETAIPSYSSPTSNTSGCPTSRLGTWQPHGGKLLQNTSWNGD